MRRLHLLAAGLLGAAVAAVPGLAAGSSPPNNASFTAVDYAWQAAGGGNKVVIAQGGTVSFAYPSGSSAHNADFASGAAPSVCMQTSGTSGGAVPPLPHQPTPPAWAGTCTFNTAGTYTFHCDAHPGMTGTIVVEAPGGTTGTTGTTTTGTTVTTGPTSPEPTVPITTGTTPAPPTTGGAAAASNIFLAHAQHGRTVNGSLYVTMHGAGGQLRVALFARGRSLGGRQHGPVRVADLVRYLRTAGSLRFSVRLSATAWRALQRRHHLKLTVKIAIQPPRGAVLSRQLTVLLSR